MDLATEHLTTYNLSYIRDNTKFIKGVVVFQVTERLSNPNEDVSTTPLTTQEPRPIRPPPIVLGTLVSSHS